MKNISPLVYGMVLCCSISFCSGQNRYRKTVQQAIGIAKAHSINTKRLDWPAIEKDIHRKAGGLCSEKDIYPVLQALVDRLEDRHSYVITAGGERWHKLSEEIRTDSEMVPPPEQFKKLKIAYVAVNPMSSAGKNRMDAYADDLFHAILSACQKDMTGWILDFRENTGGQLWPMLAGLSPLIDSDTAGCAVYPDGNGWQWWARRGKAGVDVNIHHQIENAGGTTCMEKKPVAILIGPRTASSGEASVISFIGKENVCLIGERTRGLATVNQPYELANGAKLMLTTAYFGDRNSRIYPDGIEPDIVVPGGNENRPDADIQLIAAMDWLLSFRRVSGQGE